MVTFIQLSDLHIHSRERRNNRNCRKVVDFILDRYQDEKPVVLITGDITDDGMEKQYQNAVTILRPLVTCGFKVLAVPGNHDYGFAGNIYTEESQQYFQDYILGDLMDVFYARQSAVKMEDIYPMTFIRQDVLFIGLD